jgi:hypothetical protein
MKARFMIGGTGEGRVAYVSQHVAPDAMIAMTRPGCQIMCSLVAMPCVLR